MATIKDVARLAGVSVATVSRVINDSPKASEASRLAVTSAMESLSYHPNANARALAQQSTETIGLVVGDVSDPFFGAMVKAVEQVAYNTGNFLLIGNGYLMNRRNDRRLNSSFATAAQPLLSTRKLSRMLSWHHS